MANKNKSKVKNSYEINKSIRRDWGNINPVTKVIPDKRNKKPKHKKNWEE